MSHCFMMASLATPEAFAESHSGKNDQSQEYQGVLPEANVEWSESKSNYGTVLRWWEALHGSLRLNIPQAAIMIGVPAYLEPAAHTLSHALTLPFHKQRSYWGWPDGTHPTRDANEAWGKKSPLVA
jgi:hypothetical protein